MLETEGWIEFQAAMNLLANTTGSLLIARRDLVNALKSGRIQSAATKKIRHPKTDEVMFEHDYLLDPLDWDMDHLLTRLSEVIDAEDKMLPEQIRAASPDSFVRPPEDVRIWKRDFVEVFPRAGQVTSQQAAHDDAEASKLRSSNEPKGKGGRARTHDWSAAAGALAGHLYIEGRQSHADLTRFVQRWFQAERGRAPDPREVERFVTEALRAFERAGPDG